MSVIPILCGASPEQRRRLQPWPSQQLPYQGLLSAGLRGLPRSYCTLPPCQFKVPMAVHVIALCQAPSRLDRDRSILDCLGAAEAHEADSATALCP